MKNLITPVNGSGIQTTPSHRFEDLIKVFVQDQDVRESTRSNYARVMRQFAQWINSSKLLFKDLTRAEILQYKEDLARSGMSSLTIGTYISTVRRFYEWAEGKRFYPNIAKGIRAPRRKHQFRKGSLTKEQSIALLDHYKYHIRNYAIISLLLGTGLRTIEVIRANVDDLAIKDGKRILYVHGKGKFDKSEFVKLPNHTYTAINYYLSRRHKPKSGEPLFVSTSNNNYNQRLTTRTVSFVVKEGLRSIGLDSRNLTAHSLRHTAAVTLIRAGLPIENAQLALRHSSIATTQIYLSSIQEEMRMNDNTEDILNDLMI